MHVLAFPRGSAMILKSSLATGKNHVGFDRKLENIFSAILVMFSTSQLDV